MTLSILSSVSQLIKNPKGVVSGNYLDTKLTASAVSALRVLYSFRLCISTYSGPVVNIRRASDSSAVDFYADTSGNIGTGVNGTGTTLLYWLYNTTGYITKWYDQSGRGNHMVQATAGNQPQILLSDASGMCAYFSGTSPVLTSLNNVFATSSVSNMHMINVTKEAARASSTIALYNGINAGDRFWVHSPLSDGNFYFDPGTTSNRTSLPAPAVGTLDTFSGYMSSALNKCGFNLNGTTVQATISVASGNVNNMYFNPFGGGTSNIYIYGSCVFSIPLYNTNDETVLINDKLLAPPAKNYLNNYLSSTAVNSLRMLYSFRLCMSTYSGPVVNIRRASDSSAIDFYADNNNNIGTGVNGTGTPLASWLTSTTGYVTKWYDQSGLGNHLTQATTANQPQVILSDASSVCIYFTGTYLLTSTNNIFSTSTVSNLHLFNVTKTKTLTNNTFISLYNGNYFWFVPSWSTGTAYFDCGSLSNRTSMAAPAAGTLATFSGYLSSALNKTGFNLNGTTAQITTVTTNPTADRLYLNSDPASNGKYDGYIYGLCAFSTPLYNTLDETVLINDKLLCPLVRPGNYLDKALSSTAVNALRALYSFKLSIYAYYGPVVNIRRTSDSSAVDFYADTSGNIGTGVYGTGTSLASWLSSTTGYVTKWYDQSGLGNHLTQATTTNQPQVILNDAGGICLYLNKSMTSGTGQLVTASNIFSTTTLSNMHFLDVYKNVVSGNTIYSAFYPNAPSNSSRFSLFHNGSILYYDAGTDTNDRSSVSQLPAGTKVYVSGYKSSAISRDGMMVNGTRYQSTGFTSNVNVGSYFTKNFNEAGGTYSPNWYSYATVVFSTPLYNTADETTLVGWF